MDIVFLASRIAAVLMATLMIVLIPFMIWHWLDIQFDIGRKRRNSTKGGSPR